MEYLKKAFTVPLGGEKYAEGWERIFGKKPEEAQPSRLVLSDENGDPRSETDEEYRARILEKLRAEKKDPGEPSDPA